MPPRMLEHLAGLILQVQCEKHFDMLDRNKVGPHLLCGGLVVLSHRGAEPGASTLCLGSLSGLILPGGVKF